MRFYTYRKTILTAIHAARRERGLAEATRAEDAAALVHIRNVAQSRSRPNGHAEDMREKQMTHLSIALSKASAPPDEAKESFPALLVLPAIVTPEKSKAPHPRRLNLSTDVALPFSETSESTTERHSRRTVIEVLFEFFTPAYRQYVGTAPSTSGCAGDNNNGDAYEPYLEYICTIAAVLGVRCTREDVARAFQRMGEQESRRNRQQYAPWEWRQRDYLTFAGVLTG
jgi:hypothetical protein